MSRRKVLAVVAIAAAADPSSSSFLLPGDYAGQHFGWDQTGQDTFARFAFFPILFVLLYVLRRLGLPNRDRPPDSR